MGYPKIQTLWKRTKRVGKTGGVIIPGDYSMPELANVTFYEVTEKIDGQCITVVLTKDDIKIQGKSEKSEFNKAHEELLSYIREKITRDLIDKIFDFGKASTVTLYGEGYGPKIQSGHHYREDQSFILFDVLRDNTWLDGDEVTNIAADLGIDRVPIIEKAQPVWWIEQFVESRPHSLISKTAMLEGVVCRSVPLMFTKRGDRIMFKLKCKDYDQLDRSEHQDA